MKFSSFFLMALMALSPSLLCAQRSEQDLTHGWRFHQGAAEGAESPDFNDQNWQSVNVPHDWAITGPFSRDHDLQKVAVTQNFETEASVKTGRTGGLPYVGEGWYRTSFRSTAGKQVSLVFEGAMSEAKVYVNGKLVIFWPYGYNAFHFVPTARQMSWRCIWKTSRSPVVGIPAQDCSVM